MEGKLGGLHLPDGRNVALRRSIADLPHLLTVLATRQSGGRTARLMREGDLSFMASDELARLALIFATPGASQAALHKARGSFNFRVAECIAAGTQGEKEIYSEG